MTPAILRHIRESHGLSRAELAEAIGYRPEYIRHVEMGRKNPSKRFELLVDAWIRTQSEEKMQPTP